MLSHSFDRFYVVTKFILPTTDDLKFSSIKFDSSCNYLNVGLNRHQFLTQYIPNVKNFCKKIIPFIDYYKKQTGYYNCTAQDILTKRNLFDTSKFSKGQKRKEKYNFFISNKLYWFGI